MLTSILSDALFLFVFAGTPLCLVWTWIRVARHNQLRDRKSWASAAALILATCSGLLALGTYVFAGAKGGFAYYDPQLLHIFRVGLLLSSLALMASLIGIAFRNPLRWQAPVASVGVLVFWFLAAIAE